MMTFEEHVVRRHEDLGAEFGWVLDGLTLAARRIETAIRSAGLSGVYGAYGAENVQGEAQQKLDVMANEAMMECLGPRAGVGALVSEEDEGPVVFDDGPGGKWLVIFDPLDGSSNIDVNVNVGTIFSVHRRLAGGELEGSILQAGTEQVMGGYVVYGPSTVLVYTAGSGVHGFTLDAATGSFVLTNEGMTMPQQGSYYSVNEANAGQWPEGFRAYMEMLRGGGLGREYSSRYIGSLVADFHRTLLKGGVFLYPPTKKQPGGKLRLLYEANPLAFVAEQAGGMATSGVGRILEIVPGKIHQRTAFCVGSRREMEALVGDGGDLSVAERLYYEEQGRLEFSAEVTDIRLESRTEGGGRWQVALDRTAFYPEGGGQPWDLGTLEAVAKSGARLEVPVVAVVEEDGEVWHVVEKPLGAGVTVSGRVDGGRRQDHRQQHTGQHLLSAVFLREVGAGTASFRVGRESSTIDLSVGAVVAEDMVRVEERVNALIGEDRRVSVSMVGREAAERMLEEGRLRKLPERDGTIRVVEIEGVEWNACGGTHVESTGSIGGMTLRKVERVKQGVRVEFCCGMRAVRTARRDFEMVGAVGRLLSTGAGELVGRVGGMVEEARVAGKARRKLVEEMVAVEARGGTVAEVIAVVREASGKKG